MSVAADFRSDVQSTTISELTRFVAKMGIRPLDGLLNDLPNFAHFSNSKFDLALSVLRRRIRDLPAAERQQLRMHAEGVAARTESGVAQRIRALFD